MLRILAGKWKVCDCSGTKGNPHYVANEFDDDAMYKSLKDLAKEYGVNLYE